jgi:Tol biopolymer transport system component
MKRVVVLLAACGGGSGKPDAAIDAGPRCDPAAAFGAPVAVAGLDSNLDDQGARLSPDELTVVFARARTSGTTDLYLASRASTDAAFDTPMLLGTVNSVNSEVWPTLSPDALLLLFDSDRATQKFHIFASKRAAADAAFGPPTASIALADGDAQPMLANGASLYFASSMRTGLGMGDIWRADIDSTGATGTPAAVIGDVNSAANEAAPAVTADERVMAFARDGDIYIAARSSPADGFGTAAAIAGLATMAVNEAPTWISPDGCHLYVQSDAPGGMGGLDIYMASRP